MPVIRVPARAAPPAPRLLAAVAERLGESVVTVRPGVAENRGRDEVPERSAVTHVVCRLEDGVPPAAVPDAAPGGRLLVLGLIGTHRDASEPRLRELWTLEEKARAAGAPVLVLRLAPLVGEGSPLWSQLRREPLPRSLRRRLVQPVLENDVVETLVRAFAGRAAWEGWYEVCGPEVLSFEELAERARLGPAGRAEPAWEPPQAILESQRLAEPEAWMGHFDIRPGALAQWTGATA